ncbi:NUDIX hydrolase [Microbacteriaceae bacterium VKM Ac-2855]|nr:NUDIX hydrolase [Microbacteriaceae bacterium VKM Ac-2855]
MNSPHRSPAGGWKTLDRRVAYSGRVVISEHTVELPNGEQSTFEVDESIPYAVAVLIVDADHNVFLARQYRYAIDQWIYDLPGGAGHREETVEAAARRECEEETGLVPRRLEHLHTFYPNPGRSAWPAHLFLARTTHIGAADVSDPAEQVTTVTIPLEELDALIRAGRIVDPGLLLARMYAGLKGALPNITA